MAGVSRLGTLVSLDTNPEDLLSPLLRSAASRQNCRRNSMTASRISGGCRSAQAHSSAVGASPSAGVSSKVCACPRRARSDFAAPPALRRDADPLGRRGAPVALRRMPYPVAAPSPRFPILRSCLALFQIASDAAKHLLCSSHENRGASLDLRLRRPRRPRATRRAGSVRGAFSVSAELRRAIREHLSSGAVKAAGAVEGDDGTPIRVGVRRREPVVGMRSSSPRVSFFKQPVRRDPRSQAFSPRLTIRENGCG